MAKDTVTLKLEGNVPIDLYAEAIGNFTMLIKALSEEVSESADIEWDVIDLASGSASATIRGTASDTIAVEKVVIAYGIVGHSLQLQRPIPYSHEVVEAAIGLTQVINGHIKAVKLITDEETSSVSEPIRIETQKQARKASLGVITGDVYAIWAEPRLKIALYDTVFSRRVTCYLTKDKEELARNIWHKRVAVMGMIYRDQETGRPIDVTDVISIEEVAEAQPGSFLAAHGIIPWQQGDDPSEVVIRRDRDAR